jgi:hypothetical protein
MKFKDLRFELEEMSGISRARAEFPNGCGLSVINGFGTYSDRGTYEIGPLTNGALTFIKEWGDSVKGYVPPEKIDEILKHAETDSPEDYKKFLGEYLG